MKESGKGKPEQRIVAAAAGLFARRGYESVSLADVARAARVSAAEVEQRFGDKTGLIRSLVEEFQTRYYDAIMAPEVVKPTVEQSVAQIIRNIIALYREHAPLAIAAMAASYLDIPAVH